jgi:hypothetical protein
MSPADSLTGHCHCLGGVAVHSLPGDRVCTQDTITGEGLGLLKGISSLGMHGFSDEAIAAAEGLDLPVARRRYTHYGAFETSFVEREDF